MRQIMPHRNNIDEAARTCKSFLHTLRRLPAEAGRSGAQCGRAVQGEFLNSMYKIMGLRR